MPPAERLIVHALPALAAVLRQESSTREGASATGAVTHTLHWENGKVKNCMPSRWVPPQVRSNSDSELRWMPILFFSRWASPVPRRNGLVEQLEWNWTQRGNVKAAKTIKRRSRHFRSPEKCRRANPLSYGHRRRS